MSMVDHTKNLYSKIRSYNIIKFFKNYFPPNNSIYSCIMNLLNELGKRDIMRGVLSILLLFSQQV